MMNATNSKNNIRLGLPKGRMEAAVADLLRAAGIALGDADRSYRPSIALPGFQVKRLKPQNIIQMLENGSRDLGFAGADWAAERGALQIVKVGKIYLL